MYIQLNHINYINKGAELMLCSIMDRLSQEKDINPLFVFGDMFYTDDVRQNGLHQLLRLKKFGINWENFLPGKPLLKYGLVRPKKINVLLDAAGLNFVNTPYSHLFKDLNDEVNYYKTYKDNNAKVILLPQGFGPFTSKASQERIKRVSEYIDLIFARDDQSYSHLTSVLGEQEKIRQAPDFTNLYTPRVYQDIKDKVKDAVILIPNCKMITNVSNQEAANGYINFFVDLYKFIEAKGRKVVILNHEHGDDRRIILQMQEMLDNKAEVMDYLSADEVKLAIGSSYLTISSRFHGVVSALCQGVPVLTTSWSHKYITLLDSYDNQEAMLDVLDSEQAKSKILNLLNENNNNELRSKLLAKGEEQKMLAGKMWEEVIDYIKK